jgi:hypothetical protein
MAGRLVDRVAPVHRADQATHPLTRRDRRPIFFEGTAHLSTRVLSTQPVTFAAMRWSRPANALATEVFAGRVVARPRPHGRRGVMRRERLKNRQRAAY